MNNLSGIGDSDFYKDVATKSLVMPSDSPTLGSLPEFFSNKKNWIIFALGAGILYLLMRDKSFNILGNPILNHGFSGEQDEWAYRVVSKFDVYVHLDVDKFHGQYNAYIYLKDPTAEVGSKKYVAVSKKFKNFDEALCWLDNQLMNKDSMDKVKKLKKVLYKD